MPYPFRSLQLEKLAISNRAQKFAPVILVTPSSRLPRSATLRCPSGSISVPRISTRPLSPIFPSILPASGYNGLASLTRSRYPTLRPAQADCPRGQLELRHRQPPDCAALVAPSKSSSAPSFHCAQVRGVQRIRARFSRLTLLRQPARTCGCRRGHVPPAVLLLFLAEARVRSLACAPPGH